MGDIDEEVLEHTEYVEQFLTEPVGRKEYMSSGVFLHETTLYLHMLAYRTADDGSRVVKPDMLWGLLEDPDGKNLREIVAV